MPITGRTCRGFSPGLRRAIGGLGLGIGGLGLGGGLAGAALTPLELRSSSMMLVSKTTVTRAAMVALQFGWERVLCFLMQEMSGCGM